MHGRLKVKTTEEQLKQKLIDKENKNRIFRELRDQVIDSRKKGENNKEMLGVLAECVIRSPEWNLFWNYRREILKEWNFEENLMKRELILTENCLRENSKAYAVWHHRAWVMEHDPNVDWLKELALCNQALKLDERNFHCWDYRRFVVERGAISREDELEYTKTRVTNDMSDYSSWHYRQTLLLRENDATDIDGELDLINNVVYTDPSDQSPWFYLRWLIARRNRESFLREMYVCKKMELVVMIMSEPVSLETMQQFTVDIIHCNSDTNEPTSINLVEYTPAVTGPLSAVWLLSLADIDLDRDISIEARSLNDESFLWQCQLTQASEESLIRVDTDINRMLCDNINDAVSLETLTGELSVVRELLDLEPNNKWVLLAVVSLLRVLSPIESQTEILDKLHNLATLDPLREQFYVDAASKFTTECRLISLYHSHTRHVSLAHCDLTALSHLHWMPLMTHVDLSFNRLSGLPHQSQYLLCVATLDLSHNDIASLRHLRGLRSLRHLDVSHNRIATFADLEPVLHCIRLVHLNIKANLVSQLANLTDLVASHPTSRLHIQSISIVYDKTV